MADANKTESMADLHRWFAKKIKWMVRSTWKNTFSIWINKIYLYQSCLLSMNFDFLNIADKNTIANPTAMETTTTTTMETTTTTTMETTTTTKMASNLKGK